MCRSPPPPPPPPAERLFQGAERLFQGWRKKKKIGSRRSSETFCPPPPPKQTPWRRPWWKDTVLQCSATYVDDCLNNNAKGEWNVVRFWGRRKNNNHAPYNKHDKWKMKTEEVKREFRKFETVSVPDREWKRNEWVGNYNYHQLNQLLQNNLSAN